MDDDYVMHTESILFTNMIGSLISRSGVKTFLSGESREVGDRNLHFWTERCKIFNMRGEWQEESFVCACLPNVAVYSCSLKKGALLSTDLSMPFFTLKVVI